MSEKSRATRVKVLRDSATKRRRRQPDGLLARWMPDCGHRRAGRAYNPLAQDAKKKSSRETQRYAGWICEELNEMRTLADNASLSGNRLTIAAVAITAYLCSVVIHEAGGHGLAAILLGLHPTRVSTVDLEVSFFHVPLWKVRLVSAAGCGANLLLAALAMIAASFAARRSAATRYFLWLMATINLLIPGGYLMVLTFPGIGDWGDFVRGLAHPLVWKSGLTLLGAGLSFYGLRWGVRRLEPFLGGPLNRQRAWNLTLVPYLAGSATNTLAGALNPTSPWLILISAAAATFGGTSWLLWIGSLAARRRLPAPAPQNLLVRDNRWLLAGLISMLIFFFALGPGLPR